MISMDVLKPELLWIGNCCYRLPHLKEDANDVHARNYEYVEEELQQDHTEEPCDMEYDVEVLESGRYRLSLPIPKVFWPRLVGTKGLAKKRVEDETRTQLSIPRQTQDGEIVITGGNRRDVLLAKSHVEANVRAARQRLQYTHFVSVPAQNEEIRTNFGIFKAKVQELCPSLSDEVFTFPEKLHITLVVLLLTDNRERQQACEMFQQLSTRLEDQLAGKKLKVEVKGLDIMNDDPSRSRVLYAKAEDSLLQEVADETAAWYRNSGFVKEQDMRAHVKLHITLMNARNLVKSEEDDNRRGARRVPEFDAGPILDNLKDFYFGTIHVNTIHLSQMGLYREDGYYASSSTLEF